jgi:isopentenyl-diphosphate delta-isomerase
MQNSEMVILVDENDNEIGTREKQQAHISGELHRAISVFIFNSEGKMLLQRRAHHKYHSGGLWTNACCSHPRPTEETLAAARRRLSEEMGIDCRELKHAFSFTYKAILDNNLTEHEFDHVFIGKTDQTPKINQEEVCEWKYISMTELEKDILKNPQNYTYWFKLIFDRIKTEVVNKGHL